MPYSFRLCSQLTALSCLFLALVGCSSGDSDGFSPGAGFESDSPSGPGGGRARGDVLAPGAGGQNAGDESAGDGARTIQEADIVKVDGDRLYALSRYGGLSTVDASQPRDLKLLGNFRTEATPFEMYVRGSVVLGLFNGWASYVREGDGWRWVQTSQVLVVDATDPARLRKRAEFKIPGEISDSRIVGDVLYVVARENGGCYECADVARTRVLSLNVADPSAVAKVDELSFEDQQGRWGSWAPRSVTVTQSRLYVGGPETTESGEANSTIHVVDISDPGGDLVPGTKVRVDGQINSRWQMDEHAGVLRVISQPWQWDLSTPPTVQTFRVTSSSVIEPLGRTALVLPRPEMLQSTRFDGPRAYAITFERTDPLFTIDLSDPAAPRQAGELEMPGWVYHMEPRGDRLVGVGFDQGNPAGALHVSLFDVSDLAAPRMIQRVNFGGDWGSLPEDQNRIHKAFQVLDDQGLILVPSSGSSRGYCYEHKTGVQLIDFTRDSLTLRGNAEATGETRRGFLHRDALFAVSDERVQTFDISDRSAPAKLDDVAIARHVQSAAVANDRLVRLGADWWSNRMLLDVAELENTSSPGALGALDVHNAVGNGCSSGMYGARVFAHGSRAYVVYEASSYDGNTSNSGAALAIIDVSDPAAPRLEAHEAFGFSGAYGWYGWGKHGVVPSGATVVQSGTTFVFLRDEQRFDGDGKELTPSSWLEVVDASDPADVVSTRVELRGAWGRTGLHVDGTTVLSSHYQPLDAAEPAGEHGRVRFFIDRIDVSNPRAPRVLGKVNVPGSLLAWDAESERAITVDYTRILHEDAKLQNCFELAGGGASWISGSDGTGQCVSVRYTLKQLEVRAGGAELEGSWVVPEQYYPGQAAVGDDRVFVALNAPYGGRIAVADCWRCGWGSNEPGALAVLSGLSRGRLNAASLELGSEGSLGGYVGFVLPFGKRALVVSGYEGGALIANAEAATAPRIERTVDIVGSVTSAERHENYALLSLGYDGVELVDMSGSAQ